MLGLRPPGLKFRVWRAVSSHHPQEVLRARFSLYVHKGGLKHHFISMPVYSHVATSYISVVQPYIGASAVNTHVYYSAVMNNCYLFVSPVICITIKEWYK